MLNPTFIVTFLVTLTDHHISGVTKMARTVKPLTETQVRNAKPRDNEYNLADGKGLYLRIKTNGSKLWIFNYQKPHTGKRANIGLGAYPHLSLAQARDTRRCMLEQLTTGIDPKEQRDDQRRQDRTAHDNTVKAVFEDWLIVKQTTVSEDYLKDVRRSMELHVIPRLGNVPIHKIKATNTIDILKPVAAKGALETVNRLCQRLNEVMTFAVNTGLIEHNPLARINSAFGSPPLNHFPTLKPNQLPELMVALANANIRRTTRCLIEWQLHTMVRPKEAAGTRWDEIDLDEKLWTIPAERMKRKRDHLVPLTDQALALLEVMRPISEHREYVFPSERTPRTHTHAQSANMALKRMGFHRRLVAHGLRSLASTTLNEHGSFSPDVIESALSHLDSNAVRAAYNHATYLDQRRPMMEYWSNHIENAATGSLSLAQLKPASAA